MTPPRAPQRALRAPTPDALDDVLARAVAVRAAGVPGAGRRLLQRELTVFIADEVCDDRGLVDAIVARLRKHERFAGPVWFNSEDEARSFAAGKAEGMGVWDGNWVNLAGRGTIVFGEHHNDIREEFVRALNIRHRLVEGAWERSLHGVPDTAIAAHPRDPVSHSKYTGHGGLALENYWLRAGQFMARFVAPTIEALRVFALAAHSFRHRMADEDEKGVDRGSTPDLWIPPLELPGELVEIVQTLQRTLVPQLIGDQPALRRQIVMALGEAQFYARGCEQFGLLELADLDASTADRGAKFRRRAWIDELARDPSRARWLHVSLSSLAEAVEKLAGLQFEAIASEDEKAMERYKSKQAEKLIKLGLEVSPLELGSRRREFAMLVNLRDAMLVNPPPMLVTIGARHARNRQPELEKLLDGRGCLVIGTIGDLAAIGLQRPKRRGKDKGPSTLLLQ